VPVVTEGAVGDGPGMLSRRTTPQTAAALLAAGALVLCAAAPASADSIAYIKDGNVHLATPDGARQQQVTTTGGYHYVSQADDGTMVALTGRERLHKLSRTGDVLADIATYVSDGAPTPGPVNQFAGPFNPRSRPTAARSRSSGTTARTATAAAATPAACRRARCSPRARASASPTPAASPASRSTG
jgi:hypothetical protein